MTRGGLCVKLKDYHDHHYNPDRVLYPLHRVGRKGSRENAGRTGKQSWELSASGPERIQRRSGGCCRSD